MVYSRKSSQWDKCIDSQMDHIFSYAAWKLVFQSTLFIMLLMGMCGCEKKNIINERQTILKVATESDPQTLDPRKVRDLTTVTTIQMLYEGLMRTGTEGQISPAMAEEITVSSDKKTYTFRLRESKWSDGTPVTAYDFEKTWKSLLNPAFPSPNAYQLYPILGAKEAKEGKQSVNDIGVKAEDEATLVVTLNQPTPYFLDLTATYFFYPVHASLRDSRENADAVSDIPITNGPFIVDRWKRHDILKTSPNPHYWDRENVHLQGVELILLDPSVALQLFQRGEIDWAGSPLSTLPTDSLKALSEKKILHTVPAAGLYLFRINTDKAPFNNVKIRQAFALALNRKDLVDHVLQGKQTPAMGIIPPFFLAGPSLFEDKDTALAKQLFETVLKEESLDIKDFPQVTIQYAAGERNHKIAQVAQAQWKEAFGVDVQLKSSEPKMHFDRLKQKEYSVAIGSWFADFRDPISFLEVFKRKDNGTNNTGWENPEYIALLDASALPENISERNALLREAEEVLINDMPVIPLFFSSYNYVKNSHVEGVYFSPLGYLDFKQAFFEEP